MSLVGLIPLLVVVALVVGVTLRARSRGYNLGSTVVVRCREGHLFTTIWVPFVSVKAIRLGAVRWQRCPVGNHWTFVIPVKDSDLTEEERVIAAHYRDSPIP
jgi:hypothetical protein